MESLSPRPLAAEGKRGAVAAPHSAAARAGLSVLEDGGTAVDAAVAMASVLAVVYPHMTGIGGDGFWLISQSDGTVRGVEAAGRSASTASVDTYRSKGCLVVPPRGPLAALTVPLAVSGWEVALSNFPTNLPISRLLRDAIIASREGSEVAASHARHLAARQSELAGQPGFESLFLPGGSVPAAGEIFRNPALSKTLARLAAAGLRDFYDGELAEQHARFLEDVGSPLRADDLRDARATLVEPLSVDLKVGKVSNLPPPTQGVASLMILALYERFGMSSVEGFDHIHRLVEATKVAFRLRNNHVGEPGFMSVDPRDWLRPLELDRAFWSVDLSRAAPWPDQAKDGGTVWFGACDAQGTLVSCIQSIFWEFGSGVACPATGVLFQNRGAGFSLSGGPNMLRPRARPFHTLNPAIALLQDGRRVAYGTMGGEGQPQTQAAVFTRYATMGLSPGQSISRPRWLLGRTWGEDTARLKLESGFDPSVAERLMRVGHDVEIVPMHDDRMGHAGMVVHNPSGLVEAAHDPRSDGGALGW